MIWTLAATAAGAAISGAVYLALAVHLWQREVEGADAREATRSFALYWGTTATYQGLSALHHGLAAVGTTSFALALTVRYLGLALAVVGIAALLYYLAYLRTGSRAWLARIAVAYTLVLVLTTAHVWLSEPNGVTHTAWSVDVAYGRDFMAGLFLPLLVMILVVPILGAGWYLTLLRTTTDPEQRRRILAVGAGVGLQLASFLIARLVENEAGELLSRVILSFVVATLVIAAYFHAPIRPTARSMAH